MADASATSPYILAAPDGSLPNSRNLLASGGLVIQDTGGEGTITVSTVGNLETLNAVNSQGFLVYDETEIDLVLRSFEAGTGIAIDNPAGQTDTTTISVVPNTTTQQVNVLLNGVLSSTRASLNLIPSGSVGITVGDNSLDNRTDINIAGTVAAPQDSTYILQTPDAGLPNSQALSILSTGILKSTTSTGVVSIAVPDTDYQSASANLTSISAITPDVGVLLVGNGTGFEAFPEANDPGDVLTSNGPDALPSWQAPATGNLVVVLPDPHVGPPVSLETNTTYIATQTTGTTDFQLPTSPSPGDFYKIVGAGDGGWAVLLNASQQIIFGPIATTTGGSLVTIPLNGTSRGSVIIYCFSVGSPTRFIAECLGGQLALN